MGISKPRLISIVGPTASGKSDLAVAIAKRYNGEVISADSRQVYRQLNIGTGKITKEEMQNVPHHLLDVADPTEVYTVQQFRTDARQCIQAILDNHKLPIVAGGTGQYVDALLYKSMIPIVPPNELLRDELNTYSTHQLYEHLKEKDPRRAASIEQNNKRRLVRALEIIDALGIVPPATKPVLTYPTLQIGIDLTNDTLRERITNRTSQRLDKGWIEEVRMLLASGVPKDRLAEFGLGYKYIAETIETITNTEAIVAAITQLEMQYVKRQRTWFKRNTNIHWFEPHQTSEIFAAIDTFLSRE